jgi:[ribosomal protein S5]-alanine N-acetyltransferase
MNITQTPRLLINHFTEADAPFVLEILNTPGWLQFIGDRNIKTLEAAQQYLKEKFLGGYEKFGFGMFAVRLKENNETIGMCGLVKRDHLQHADIGYAFLPQHAGKGYAIEAAAAVLQYANHTLKLHPILAIVTPDNNSSVKLLQKLNFVLQGTITDNDTELLLFKNETGANG